MEIFEKANIGTCVLKNRLIRSATYEGMCDEKGFPQNDYYTLYENLAKNGVGAIITGFAYVSINGKAIQTGQAGIDSDEKIGYYKKLSSIVHQYDCKIFMQIAHAGRQTMQNATRKPVVGASAKRSRYYQDKPVKLTISEINSLIEQFGEAALRAKKAGFDGIQLHAAHGYLIHQFLLPSINNRNDEFGIDPHTKIGSRFLELIIEKTKLLCEEDFPVLVKISGSDDYKKSFSKNQLINLIKILDNKQVNGIEISFGTMDFYALNIFRGDFPENLILGHNPLFKSRNNLQKHISKLFIFPLVKSKLKSFTPMYNIEYAKIAKKFTNIPIILVGGFRSQKEIDLAITNLNIDFVSMCRPFIAEPDLVLKLKEEDFISKCCNCNYCAVMCDSKNKTKCYKN
ncbi:NADH:flavin oxidoreductase [Bacteroidota bacterium]